jgi:hypothetical protein
VLQVFKKHLGKDLSEEDYEVMEIENNPDCDAIQNYLKKLTGARSVSIYAYIYRITAEVLRKRSGLTRGLPIVYSRDRNVI